MFFILSSAVAFGQVESYRTTIYTSDELAAEIQTVVDDNNIRRHIERIRNRYHTDKKTPIQPNVLAFLFSLVLAVLLPMIPQ